MYPGFQVGRHHRLIAQKLEAVERGDLRRLIIECPPRHGKPVYNGTMILMGDGSRKPIADVQIGDTVISHRGLPRIVTALVSQGALPCVRITTRAGRQVVAALNHPFLTADGWRDAKDLQIGQGLGSVPLPQTVPSQEGRPVEEFRLAGYFIGDGSTSWNQGGRSCAACITAGDPAIEKDIAHCAATLGFQVQSRTYARKDGIAVNARRYDLSKGVRPWLKSTELAGGTSRTKRVPSWIFSANTEQIGHFIAAYFGCDGSINRRGGARSDLVAEAYSVNRDLLADVQHLLLRLGITSRVSDKNGSDFHGKPHASYRLTVTSQDAMARFAEAIPLIGGRLERLRGWSVCRSAFDAPLLADQIVSIEDVGKRECSCITVDIDHTYTVEDLVCHNSLETSQLFPAWYLGRDPNRRIIACSHAAPLALDFSFAVRGYVQSEEYRELFPEVAVAAGAGEKERWSLANPTLRDGNGYARPYLGQYIAAGVEGSIMGRGSNLLLVDDPVKSWEEAMSNTRQEHIWNWFSITARTRLQPGAAIVIIMTRWTEGDLTGRLLQRMQDDDRAERWEVIHLPAIAEANDQLGRKVGAPLWPEQFPLDALKALEVEVGSRAWTGLFQQRPAPQEGRIFKRDWWQRYQKFDRASAVRIIQTWDTALETKNRNDYSVCATWAIMGKERNQAWLVDVWRDRVESPELYGKVQSLYAHWRPHEVCIEDSSVSKSLIQSLERFTKIPLIRLPPRGDKVARAHSVTPWIEGRRVYLPESAPWLHDFEEEHAAFDNAAHDDQVDTTTMALDRLFGEEVKEIPRARPYGITRASPYLDRNRARP